MDCGGALIWLLHVIKDCLLSVCPLWLPCCQLCPQGRGGHGGASQTSQTPATCTGESVSQRAQVRRRIFPGSLRKFSSLQGRRVVGGQACPGTLQGAAGEGSEGTLGAVLLVLERHVTRSWGGTAVRSTTGGQLMADANDGREGAPPSLWGWGAVSLALGAEWWGAATALLGSAARSHRVTSSPRSCRKRPPRRMVHERSLTPWGKGRETGSLFLGA